MRGRAPGGPLAALVIAAGLLAAGLVALALLAAHSLEQRDAAVREGMLLRLASELEAGLRESGPERARETLDAFLSEHAQSLTGVDLITPAAALAVGDRSGAVLEAPLRLGRGWGGGPMHGGGAPGHGPRAGVRLFARPGIGAASGLASAVVAGGLIAAVALLALAFAAARGLTVRARLAAAEAERERLAAVALAGAGLAHRIRNPLAGIKGTAQLLAERLASPERERAGRIVEASERIEAQLSRLLDFARPPETHPEATDLAAAARLAAEAVRGEVRVAGEGRAWADPGHVADVLAELLANARGFDPDGALDVTIHRAGRVVVAEVGDRGPGPQLEGEQAFAPYATSRADGTGLGLAIARALAQANGGELELESRPGGGALARLTVPAVEE